MIGNFRDERDIGAGALQDCPVHPLHVARNQCGERRDTRLLDLLFESNDDAHVNSSAPTMGASRTPRQNAARSIAGRESSATRSEPTTRSEPKKARAYLGRVPVRVNDSRCRTQKWVAAEPLTWRSD